MLFYYVWRKGNVALFVNHIENASLIVKQKVNNVLHFFAHIKQVVKYSLKSVYAKVWRRTVCRPTHTFYYTVVNGKVDESQVQNLISESVGEIPAGTSVKEYVDNAIGSGGTDAAEAIAAAKQEAIEAAAEYTDEKVQELSSAVDTKIGDLGDAADVITYITNVINNSTLKIVEF